jgi:hypothetical protein
LKAEVAVKELGECLVQDEKLDWEEERRDDHREVIATPGEEAGGGLIVARGPKHNPD